MIPPLKAIFFDAVGTMIHLPRTVGEHYRDVALDHDLDVTADAFDQAFRACWKAMPERSRSDGPRPDDDRGWWRDLVSRVLGQTVSSERRRHFDEAAYFEAVYAHFTVPGVWAVYPEVHGVLRMLRERGFRLGVISNFDRRLHRVLEDLRLTPFFENITVSSEVGADKPDPVIFRHALASLQLTSAEAVHVGDDPQRDWGANVAGLDIFELVRPAQSLEDVVTWLDARAAR